MATGNVVSEQRAGLKAYRDSVELALPDVVERLREAVGVRVVAYVANVRNTRPVGEWATGQRSPGAEDEARLRLAFQAVELMRGRYDTATVATWLMGSNPSLGYEAPARFIRENRAVDVAKDVMAAASSFALIG